MKKKKTEHTVLKRMIQNCGQRDGESFF